MFPGSRFHVTIHYHRFDSNARALRCYRVPELACSCNRIISRASTSSALNLPSPSAYTSKHALALRNFTISHRAHRRSGCSHAFVLSEPSLPGSYVLSLQHSCAAELLCFRTLAIALLRAYALRRPRAPALQRSCTLVLSRFLRSLLPHWRAPTLPVLFRFLASTLARSHDIELPHSPTSLRSRFHPPALSDI